MNFRRIKNPFRNEIVSLEKKFDAIYPSVNILLDRDGIPYKREDLKINLFSAS